MKYHKQAQFRAPWWDYRWPNAYYVSINTHKRKHILGSVHLAQVQLSPLGIIADILWNQIPYHQKHVKIGPYVIMPNHIHGILILDPPQHGVEKINGERTENSDFTPCNLRMSAISPKSYSLSAVIRSYKSAVTYHANRLQLPNGWQPRFFDRIIRNQNEFNALANYIDENPNHWPENPPHPKGFPENSFPF